MDSEGADGNFQYVSHSPPQHARMHRLFLIQELLYIICEHVRNDHTSSIVAGRTLASLARTSTVFHHVATSALWSRLDGLAPLLRSFDLHFASLDAAARPQPALTLRRPLRIAEWEKLRSLAHRVEHLCVHDPTRPLDVSTVCYLSHPPTTSPLFPRLKSILWNDDRAETFSFIRTLSGPTITSLAIRISNDSRTWRVLELGILASLPYLFPNVTEVTLPTNALSNAFRTMSEALCAWKNLAEIKCGAIELTALAHLAKQPALRKLSFNMLNNPALGISLPSGAFSCVRDFEIHAANLSFLETFINSVEGSSASLHVLVDTNPPFTSITSFFTALRRFTNTQLQDLSLRWMTPAKSSGNGNMHVLAHPQAPHVGTYVTPPINMMGHPFHVHLGFQHPLPPNGTHVLPLGGVSTVISPPTSQTLTSRDFMPLACFGNLGRIDINVDHNIHLDDDSLGLLVSAWPHLYSFSLNDTAGWRVKSGITQIGLIAMIECCPNLEKLCIALNTDAFIEVPSDREGIENTAMQTLGLADSLIEARATVAVAAFLSDIFPNLTAIVAWDSAAMSRRLNAGIYAERWMHVSEQVRGMNRVRAQERRWW
ncbi:hypothetical protein DEU56DRAFT_826037 [Suillus clintonianus]|uniref:uncharacterized protein n=1 Tax=Suillus clintonianus TaxID=1904413 RepID=UPI001B86AA18|nr:uncharacterized protein DEU56DRAFT_826037 [Suillus clintonianus]KAG2125037.1 hypothetical protein DEU56DRAFT_826037 [Suillus clintonianus]